MKTRIFLLIFLGIFLFYFIPLISSLQANIIPYNFTNLSDRNAYKEYPATSQRFNGTESAGNYGNATTTEYTNLQTRDGSTAAVWPRGGNDNPFWRFNFTVKEANNNRANIQWLTVNLTGSDNATEVGTAYIWNWSSGAWVSFGTTPSSNGNISRNYTENVNATNFIDSSSGNVSIVIEGAAYDIIDGLFFDFVQVDIMYTSDVEPPQWSSNSTNSTLAGSTINHSVYWTDDVGFSGYIFSFNNGNGSFLNDTWTAMTSDNWTNVSKVVNSTVGSIINWSVYVNDSSNNWNVTSIFNYTTTEVTDPCTCTDGASWTIINGDQCVLSTSCNLGNNRFRILDGALRIASTGRLIAQGCYIQNTESLFVISGGKLICR